MLSGLFKPPILSLCRLHIGSDLQHGLEKRRARLVGSQEGVLEKQQSEGGGMENKWQRKLPTTGSTAPGPSESWRLEHPCSEEDCEVHLGKRPAPWAFPHASEEASPLDIESNPVHCPVVGPGEAQGGLAQWYAAARLPAQAHPPSKLPWEVDSSACGAVSVPRRQPGSPEEIHCAPSVNVQSLALGDPPPPAVWSLAAPSLTLFPESGAQRLPQTCAHTMQLKGAEDRVLELEEDPLLESRVHSRRPLEKNEEPCELDGKPAKCLSCPAGRGPAVPSSAPPGGILMRTQVLQRAAPVPSPRPASHGCTPTRGQTPESPDGQPLLPQTGRPSRSCLPPTGDSWGVLACLCAVLWHLPAVPALNRTGDPGPGPSIQKTYDLTRYLEHQLRSLAGAYLNYLGPPFNEPDFNPPRLGAETLPRATVNLDVWRSLNDKLRLTQNYEAYSHLLCYLRGLNRQAATAELRRSLAHFCTSLQGLLGSIAGVMAALGYPLPQPGPGAEPAWAPGPAHSDFLQKMDDFWLLKELQTWLWRSAKDFNRLKKKMQPAAAAVTLRLEARGF
ncbi:PREDICTED: cardiotrophin-like cytokine factor 1 [Condylura cristata]|uniref:cardiotrophin-like cytokine factor 1 n=1 Tax=Condylura cristata TaxID=143302 RepID=UPI000642EEFD|nr:PREDICTED: cardiotrophin-like cytokine factor 1 [Condylura cristata]